MPTSSVLWIYFVVFAVIGTLTFVYAFHSLNSSQDVERQIMEMQDRVEEE